MSIRRINYRLVHPMDHSLEVLFMDDDFTSVVPRGSLPDGVSTVKVSGKDVDIGGIRSLGDVVEPLTGAKISEKRQCVGMTIGDCFHGQQLSFYMWGRKGSIGDPQMVYGSESDQTELVLNPGDRLACVTGDRDFGFIYSFDAAGNRIENASNLPKIGILRNYYTFCGILSADKKFTAHCIWNNLNNVPVGPPYDRRMAKFVGIDFAPTCDTWAASGHEIMVRVDGNMPIVMDP